MMNTEKSRSSVEAPEREQMDSQNAATPCETQFDSTMIAAGLQGRLALKPKEAAPLIGVGNNMIYQLCHRADFPAIKVGAGIIIPVDALRQWLNNQAVREVAVL